MTPERRAELQRLVAAWRSPDPMRQEDAAELPSAAAELLAEVERLETAAKDIASLEATLADIKTQIAVWDDKAASLAGDLGSIVEAEDKTAEQIAAWLVRWTSRGEVATRTAAAALAGFIRSGKWRLS